jgi:uncharacterized protein YjbI with pentapeptide repeats/transcriptional regulator with XRE-family HTH domain
MGRSYTSSEAGLEKLGLAFNKSGKTQECLAGLVGCTRNTVSKFLKGKPITKELFISLCNKLELDYLDIAEIESGKPKNSGTAPNMNRPISNIAIPRPEKTGALTLVAEPNNVQTSITFDTINGQVIITIPGDIDSFRKNFEQQEIWLEFVKRASGDANAKIIEIKEGSIKIIFGVSSDGIEKLREDPNKILLVARIISRAKGEELDLSDTDLSGVDLSGVDLSGINLSCADLSNANLENTNLENADLDCADLSGANLKGANLKGTSLNDAIIDDKWLTVWKIVNQSSVGQKLRNAYLIVADLTVTFLIADLIFTFLIVAFLIVAFLIVAFARGADLIGAFARGAFLIVAFARGADLIGAFVRGPYLIGAFLIGAFLTVTFARVADLKREEERNTLARASSSSEDDSSKDVYLIIVAFLIVAFLIVAFARGANLANAKVQDAQFGNNSGITEDAKRELERRGAIFEDSLGDRSPVPSK